jgi:ABC-2 type transport system permease protein
MRQLVQMFLFDARTSFKSFMGAYMVAAPMLILLILRFFLPSVQDAATTVAVVNAGRHAVDAQIIAELDEYFDVAIYESIEEMEKRLRGTGSAEGLYYDPDSTQFVSVMERNIEANTVFSSAARVIRQYYYREKYPQAGSVIEFSASVPPELRDRTQNSPVATMGGSIFVAFVGLISAFLIGLGVVNDKESGTDRALQVSPMSRVDYYVGKSVFPLLVMLVYPAIAVLVLGLAGTNLLQVYVAVVLSFSVTLLLGLIVGALGDRKSVV